MVQLPTRVPLKAASPVTMVQLPTRVPLASLLACAASTSFFLFPIYASHSRGMTVSVTISYTDMSLDNRVLWPLVFSFSFAKNHARLCEVVVNVLLRED